MIQEIKVKQGTLVGDILCQSEYRKMERLTLLLGGNGAGKTTLIKAIEKGSELEFMTSNSIRPYLFQNSEHNHRLLEANVMTKSDLYIKIARQKIEAQQMSEGQSIIYSLLSFFEYVKQEALVHSTETIVVLLDEVDSGLTPDHLNMVMHWFIELLDEYSNVQIIVSCNQYHWIHCVKRGLNLQTGEWVSIQSYDDFAQMYLDQMVELGRRRELKFLQASEFMGTKLNRF